MMSFRSAVTEVRMHFVKHDRITVDRRILVGKPVIKGTRIPVEQILRDLGSGMEIEDVLDAYPRLTVDDIQAAIQYAADVISNEDIELSYPDDSISSG
jgi:uncharacterized protein (DUF433 family)